MGILTGAGLNSTFDAGLKAANECVKPDYYVLYQPDIKENGSPDYLLRAGGEGLLTVEGNISHSGGNASRPLSQQCQLPCAVLLNN